MSKIDFRDINDDEIRIISNNSNSHPCRPPDNQSSDLIHEINYCMDNVGDLIAEDCPNVTPEENPLPANFHRENSLHSRQDECDKPVLAKPDTHKRQHKLWPWIIFGAGVVALVLLLFYLFTPSGLKPKPLPADVDVSTALSGDVGSNSELALSSTPNAVSAIAKGYVAITDTTVNGVPLTILTPCNATPLLSIGADALNDSSAVLVVQAADIRRDNGEIVGAYVTEGQLISKGQSKAGFCAIINGKPIVGVADSTPYLEQAIDSEGYFFRQYPLVVAGQVVENKPKGESLRKALAEFDGQVVVIISRKPLSFHDFAQSLVDLGVTNAIYLVGSSAYGFAIDNHNTRFTFGKKPPHPAPNINYIVWK